jgi:monofunctional biosynthetic peptidoglycan transglycosylase
VTRAPSRQRRFTAKRILLAGLVALGGWVLYEVATLPDAGWLANQNPDRTALMLARENEARELGRKPRHEQRWVSLSSIAPHAVEAVIISEDASFYLHHGVDMDELNNAISQAWAKGSLGRGASTITMQLARNLWLSRERTLLRKLKEMVLAHRLEGALPKKRILTLYLNVVEWGDGIYGIDAAARTHFGAPANELSLAQGAILAAMLPAPRRWLPSKRPRILRTSALRIIERLKDTGKITDDEASGATDDIDRILGSAPPETADESELPDEDR